ncbi:uncharacterized protein LOC124161281 [Ischnura elegans]|uniref:uncharacterized protein LOC124161281 n=1 Tax=Ischnura elegans TaxID=197161 RepID=UPI001ED8B886|nr:uncharacterized protein LOC124161281 [Ischnura elegans]XP_046393532.1 uncharacterized protein LOC124161281 [Ischnura elegans]XP_046393533.1 uncharacterized protein LOC124161281 [Ischnura elegans]XP_046393535.1 uncharacterized protein LOC124161281 [Ischnura elegans]
MIMDLIAGKFCKSNDSDSIETLNYNDSSSSIHKEKTDCSPSLAVARHSDSSEALESEDIIEPSSFMSSMSKGDMAGHARKRKGEKMSAYEESMYNLCAEKIRIQIKILEEKAKREEEIHKGELEIQELQKMYWRDKIKKND